MHIVINFTNNSINKVFNKFTCPPGKEIAIYIHGAWEWYDRLANEQFNRTVMSLMSNNYTIPLFGFSGLEYTNRQGRLGYCKKYSRNERPKLAQFVVDFKNKCKDTDILVYCSFSGCRSSK